MKFSSFNEVDYDEGYLSQTPDEPSENLNDMSVEALQDVFPYASSEHQDKFLEQRRVLDLAAFTVLFDKPEIAQALGVSKIVDDHMVRDDPQPGIDGLGETVLDRSVWLPDNSWREFIHQIGVEFYDLIEESKAASVVSNIDYSEQEVAKSSAQGAEQKNETSEVLAGSTAGQAKGEPQTSYPEPQSEIDENVEVQAVQEDGADKARNLDTSAPNVEQKDAPDVTEAASVDEDRKEGPQIPSSEGAQVKLDQDVKSQGVPKFDDPSTIAEEKQDPERTKNTVSSFGTVEDLIKAAKAHQIKLNGSKDLYADWIVRPANWPNFIEFPSPKQKRSVDFANSQSGGVLPEETIKKFNESFQEYADQMQDRAKQMDGYICDFNHKYFEYKLGAFNTSLVFMSRFRRKSSEYRDFYNIKRKRANLEKTDSENLKTVQRDPFQDVKWAILLNPTKASDDPVFKQVAQWGHGAAVTRDGGRLAATETSIFVPGWGPGTKQAGALAVAEAFERGWETIDISGNEEFIEGAKEALAAYGMGGKLVTQSGLLARKTEFIMPDPPAYFKALEKTPSTDQELNSDIGKSSTPGGGEAEVDLIEDEKVKIGDRETEKEAPPKNQASSENTKPVSLSRPGLVINDLREADDPFESAEEHPENETRNDREDDFEFS